MYSWTAQSWADAERPSEGVAAPLSAFRVGHFCVLPHFYFCVLTRSPTQRTMACCPLYAVQTSSVKIIETFGAFKTIARPGLNCLIPFVDNIATTVSMRLQQMEIACETKSRDNVRIAKRKGDGV